MARQYKRVYELTIVPPDGEARVIKDLRVNFEITKSILSFPNLAKIVIYNPNKDTLAALQKKFTKVTMNVGYEGDVRLLFKGELRNVFQSKFGVDRIITVYAGDGQRDWQNAVFNKTFTENVSIRAVMNEVLKTFKGLTIGTIEGLPDIADKLRGQSLSGSSSDIMDQFAEQYGFDWSIQDEELIIVPFEEPLQGAEAALINAATGMIGSPSLTLQSGIPSKEGVNVSQYGVDVTTLLNPRLLPNRSFKIESLSLDVQIGNLLFTKVNKTTAEGLYKIQEVTFKGDSREGDWLSMVKGRSLDNA